MVAWLSLAVAALALIYAYRRDKKQTEALDLERKERKEADGAARLVGDSSGHSRSEQRVDYPVRVRNIGKSPAYDVYVWIATHHPGDHPVGGPLTNEHPVSALVTGDDPVVVTLTQGRIGEHPQNRDGRIRARWKDGNGEHENEEIGRVTVWL